MSDDLQADFLARERAALGSEADLFAGESTSYSPSMTSDSMDQFTSNVSSPTPGETSLVAAEHSGFNQTFPKAEELESSQAFHNAMLPDEESEAVRQWKKKYNEDIRTRKEDEETKKAETLQKAREDIDKFYEDYNEKKQRKIEENREREEQQAKDREDSTGSNIWERVSRESGLLSSKTANTTGPKRDVSRMKELMLDLRKDEKAPGTIVES